MIFDLLGSVILKFLSLMILNELWSKLVIFQCSARHVTLLLLHAALPAVGQILAHPPTQPTNGVIENGSSAFSATVSILSAVPRKDDSGVGAVASMISNLLQMRSWGGILISADQLRVAAAIKPKSRHHDISSLSGLSRGSRLGICPAACHGPRSATQKPKRLEGA